MNRDPGRYDAILDAAEKRMREQGFHAVSFRDLAADIGIKSASVHYHFPQKEDLGVALVERYSERVLSALPDNPGDGLSIDAGLDKVTEVYRRALSEDGRLCLCLMLGAERNGLPVAIQTAIADFFDRMRLWLKELFAQRYQPVDAERHALATLANLQGAMLLAWASHDPALFSRALTRPAD